MKRCLWCLSEIQNQHSIEKLLLDNDCLCDNCRNEFKIINKVFKINDLKVHALYEYNTFISSVIIQYKECMDEALFDCFIQDQMQLLKLKYRNCTFIIAPSSNEKIKQRGFNHVYKVFEKLNIEMIDAFIKVDNTKQMLLRKNERAEIGSKIILKDNLDLKGKKLILIDDVCTTGSTLLAMKSQLKNYNCCGALVISINKITINQNNHIEKVKKGLMKLKLYNSLFKK